MKKTFLIINILLFLLLGLRVYGLYRRIGPSFPESGGTERPVNRPFQRTSMTLSDTGRNLFGVTAAAETSSPGEGKTDMLTGDVKELVSAGKTIRLVGVFLSGENRFAAFSIENEKGARNKELLKAGMGEEVSGFEIKEIRPDAVELESQTGGHVRLTIFKP